MTAEQSAFKKFQDEPFFEVLIQSVARTAAEYTYARIKHDTTLGAGTTVNCIIRKESFKRIEKLEKMKQS